MYTLGCPKMHLFPWNIPWPGANESLSDVGFENIFDFFLILFIPRASNKKKPFRGFSEILLHNIEFMNLHNFSYFDPTKNSANFLKIIFSGIPNWLRSNEKICSYGQCILGSGFWARYHRNVIFLGHPNAQLNSNYSKMW